MHWFFWVLIAYLMLGVLANVWFAFMPRFLSPFDRLMILLLWPLLFFRK